MKSGKFNFLEPSGSLQVCNGTALPLPFTVHRYGQWRVKLVFKEMIWLRELKYVPRDGVQGWNLPYVVTKIRVHRRQNLFWPPYQLPAFLLVFSATLITTRHSCLNRSVVWSLKISGLLLVNTLNVNQTTCNLSSGFPKISEVILDKRPYSIWKQTLIFF